MKLKDLKAKLPAWTVTTKNGIPTVEYVTCATKKSLIVARPQAGNLEAKAAVRHADCLGLYATIDDAQAAYRGIVAHHAETNALLNPIREQLRDIERYRAADFMDNFPAFHLTDKE